MITDVKIIFQCVDSARKHYRLAVETFGGDLFTDKITTEILPCAPIGQANNARIAIIKAYKATQINIIK